MSRQAAQRPLSAHQGSCLQRRPDIDSSGDASREGQDALSALARSRARGCPQLPPLPAYASGIAAPVEASPARGETNRAAAAQMALRHLLLILSAPVCKYERRLPQSRPRSVSRSPEGRASPGAAHPQFATSGGGSTIPVPLRAHSRVEAELALVPGALPSAVLAAGCGTIPRHGGAAGAARNRPCRGGGGAGGGGHGDDGHRSRPSCWGTPRPARAPRHVAPADQWRSASCRNGRRGADGRTARARWRLLGGSGARRRGAAASVRAALRRSEVRGGGAAAGGLGTGEASGGARREHRGYEALRGRRGVAGPPAVDLFAPLGCSSSVGPPAVAWLRAASRRALFPSAPGSACGGGEAERSRSRWAAGGLCWPRGGPNHRVTPNSSHRETWGTFLPVTSRLRR